MGTVQGNSFWDGVRLSVANHAAERGKDWENVGAMNLASIMAATAVDREATHENGDEQIKTDLAELAALRRTARGEHRIMVTRALWRLRRAARRLRETRRLEAASATRKLRDLKKALGKPNVAATALRNEAGNLVDRAGWPDMFAEYFRKIFGESAVDSPDQALPNEALILSDPPPVHAGGTGPHH